MMVTTQSIRPIRQAFHHAHQDLDHSPLIVYYEMNPLHDSLSRPASEDGVSPAIVPTGTPMADVSGAFHAIYMVGDALGPTMLYGMGAGMMPTGSAVVGDITQIAKALNNTDNNCYIPRFLKIITTPILFL